MTSPFPQSALERALSSTCILGCLNMRNCFKLVKKWKVSLKRTRAAEEGRPAGHRCRNAAFQSHNASSHEEPGAARKYTCIKGDKSAWSAGLSLSRGRSISHELIDNARVFSDLSRDVARLIDEVGNATSKLVPPQAADHLDAHHFSLLASQVLKNVQRSSATCKHIDTVIADSVDRVRQGLIVMEQAGLQMLHVIDSVVQASEVTAFMGNTRQAAPDPEGDDDSELLLQESALAVQDLKCWALVLKRNLQTLRLSEPDEDSVAVQQIGDGTRG